MAGSVMPFCTTATVRPKCSCSLKSCKTFRPASSLRAPRIMHNSFRTDVMQRSRPHRSSFSTKATHSEILCSSTETAQTLGESSTSKSAAMPGPGRSLVVTRTAETAQVVEVPTASLSRVIYSTMQPAGRVGAVRTAGGSPGRSGSPFTSIIPSLLVLVLTVGTAAAAAMRARLRAVRECRSCHGYGVQRCKLCSGRGTIEWEGKMAHREPCPMCLGKRMNPCTCCGGGPMMARKLFGHYHRTGADIPDAFSSVTNNSTSLGKLIRRLRRKDGEEDDDDKMEQSDQFKEQIMMD